MRITNLQLDIMWLIGVKLLRVALNESARTHSKPVLLQVVPDIFTMSMTPCEWFSLDRAQAYLNPDVRTCSGQSPIGPLPVSLAIRHCDEFACGPGSY